MRSYPLRRGIAILQPSREGMFGCQTVIHRDDDTSDYICQAAAEGVLGIKVAKLPATGMKKDQDRERAAPLRRVYPDGDIPRRARNQPVFNAGNRFRFTARRYHHF